jgi:cytochrome P450
MIGAVRDGLAFRRDPLAFLAGLGGGDVVAFRAGLSEFTLLRGPDTIHRVLVRDAARFGEGKWTLRGERVMGDCLITREGAAHRERRMAIAAGFERRRLLERAPAMARRARTVSSAWQDGELIDVQEQMGRIALVAAAEALFEFDLEADAPELLPALRVLLHEIPRPAAPWPAGRRLRVAQAVVDSAIERALRARDGALPAPLDTLEPEAARREIAALLIAAIDTTPGTLTWAWRELAGERAAEEALHAELDQAAAADPSRLPVIDGVLREVLRLHPPVHFIDRRPLADVELEGRRLRAGSFLLLSPLVTHRDARFYRDPEAFRPARWEDDPPPRWAYFPFGAGPHTCIGMHLARLEMTHTIAEVARRWRLENADGARMRAVAR